MEQIAAIAQPASSPKAVILLVDDEPMVLKMLQTFLTSQNYQILCASGGKEALAVIERQQHAIDLLITDIRMPDMNGVSLLEAVRQLYPSLPVILMTGYTDFDLVVKGLKQRAFDLLLKPIDFDQLNWCISRALAFILSQRLEQQYRNHLEEQVAKQTEQLCNQLEELQQAQHRVREVDELKHEFLCLISHEFRTPLNGIMGAIQLMELEESHSSESMALLKSASQRMENLISDLLALVEARAAKPSAGHSHNNPANILTAIISRFTPRATKAGISFNAVCAPSCESLLNGPWDALHIVANCLLDNAFKFTGQGGTVRCHIRCESHDNHQVQVMLQVTDTGEGIPAIHQEVIFQPFSQLEHYMTRRNNGIGIGLAIVRSFCDKLGGSLILDSEPGKGSCFTCSLTFTETTVDLT